MITVPNQKIITCSTWEGGIPNGLRYSILIHTIDNEAMKRLSGNGYKLYHYLYNNKNGFDLALSPVAVKEKTGMGKSAYDNAVRELMDNGYITNVCGNKYRFSIKPISKPVDGRTVDGKTVDGKHVDGRTLSPDNRMTGSMVTGGPSPDNRMTGSMVTGGEINTHNTIYNTDINIWDYLIEEDNISREGIIDGADNAKIKEVAFALIGRDCKRYTDKMYEERVSMVKNAINYMQKMDDKHPLWQYFGFESDEACKKAAEKGLQYKLDDEVPF